MTSLLPHSQAAKDRFVTELADKTQRELKDKLRTVCKHYLKERRVRFYDVMGAVGIEVEHRLSGHYVISCDDVWWSHRTRGPNYLTGIENEHPFVKEVQDLLVAYVDVSNRLFALEFSFYVGGT